MYNLDQWATFKHTHRSFDLQEAVSEQLVQELRQIADTVLGTEGRVIFIQDKQLIERIYDHSELPNTDQFKFERYVSRKNSQLLAPLLVMVEVVDKAKRRSVSMKAGKFYSKAAHHVIERGWQTGFCICFEERVGEMLFESGYLTESVYTGPMPFFCVGHHDQSVPWNFQQRDINRHVGTYDKPIPAEAYITVT
jgi:hypothetical protein